MLDPGGTKQPWPATITLILWLVPCLYYGIILTDGSFNFFRHAEHGLIFNSVLSHLLHGQFDVDPDAVQHEAFIRDGRTYTYFGIFCALLRLPLLATSRLNTTDVSTLSVLIAACTGWLFRLLCLRTALLGASSTAVPTRIVAVIYLGFALGGENIQYLRPSVYQEVIIWSDALASAFVFVAVNIVVARRVGLADALRLSVISGLVLLTRFSTAMGLYFATALILLVQFWRDVQPPKYDRANGRRRLGSFVHRAALRALSPPYVVAAAVLLLFAGITGIVNYERWGDPFTFADLHIYEVWANGFVKVVDEYGACNLVRIPFGILYYFVPIWAILRDDGAFVLSGNPPGVVPNMELPPSSFFLTDPLVLGLAVTFFFVAARRGSRAVLDVPVSYALLAGLAVPMFLILTAIVMTFRYRMEFYPFFDAAAFLCLLALARSGAFARGRCWQVAMAGAALCGMISSHLMLLFYKIASGGWAGAVVMPDGWGAFLRRLMEQHYPSIQHVLDRLLS